MDYILYTIDKKLKRFEGKAESKIYKQVKVEYSFYLLLSYFWDKNFQQIGIDDFVKQGNIVKEIQRPSIGTIASLIQKLDIHSELEKNKKENTELTSYANLRNDIIGHGYDFEDNLQNYSNSFDDWYNKLIKLRVQILSRNTDLIVVEDYDNSTGEFTGTIFDHEGESRSNWRCSKQICEFVIDNLYASYELNNYIRLSPFIHIELGNDDLFVYRNLQQPLLGKIRYNQIGKTNNEFYKSWKEFEFSANNGIQSKQINGSIINNFTPNYKQNSKSGKYIDVGSIKEKVYSFLTGKERGYSVCITLWGHGGNGKTATAQKICEELSFDEKRPFEFIIFLSAKDREMNKYTGKIDPITFENRVNSFEDLIKKLNILIFSEESIDIQKIVAERSKMLIVIDDYETFEDIDKEKISSFIKQLHPDFHKIIITTRNSFLKIGDDIQTNELDHENTKKFLMEVLENEHNYSPLQLQQIASELNKNETYKKVHIITLGKPIEIIRFVNCFVQKGKLTEDFLRDMERVNSRSERIEFLYGRNYEQLQGDKEAQDIFVIMGLLTPQENLTSLVKHIKLILRKDEDESKFNAALDKLVKLRLIELDEDGSYRLDSKDILEIMNKEYNKRDHNFKSGTKAIYDRIKANITSDTDRAVLNHVKTLRHQSNSETTIQQYKEILKHGIDFSRQVKLEALLDLCDFLFNIRGEKEKAIKTFDEYFDEFYEFEVFKRYASYSWSINREKSIKILSDFYANYSNKGLSLTKIQKLHVLSLIVLRESQFWNDKYEKEHNNRGKNKTQLQRIFNNYGHTLFGQSKTLNIKKDLNSEVINDISLAFEQFADVCYRIDNTSFAINICEYAISNFPERLINKFRKKLNSIRGSRYFPKPSQPLDKITEFGEQLQKALSKNIENKNIENEKLDIINLEVKEKGYFGTVYSKSNDTKYGYLKIDSNGIKGRIYFNEKNLNGISFENLKLNSTVEFGFGQLNIHNKYGAINVKLKS